MKIKIYKENEDIFTKLVINNNEEKFDYVNLINRLYSGEKLEEPIFDEHIDDWEKEAIKKLIDDIDNAIKVNSVENNK